MKDPAQDDTGFNYHERVTAQDPYPVFRELRQGCPLGFSSALFGGFYFATSYEGVKSVFADFRAFTSTGGSAPDLDMRLLPVDFDPPRHTIWRRIIARHFSTEAAARSEPTIRKITNDLIDGFIESGTADGVRDFARPLLTHVMFPVIGVPTHKAATLNEHLGWLALNRESGSTGAAPRLAEIGKEILSVIKARRDTGSGDDDLLQCLIDEQFEGRQLTDQEIFQTLLPTLFGALDSTSSVISQALYHLATHPEDKQRLISGEIDWADAVEEFVRLAAPIQAVRRVAVKPVVLDGGTVPAGASVVAMPGAANRDPAMFADADTCLLGRDAREHLSFGAGAHICIGRNFARVMIRTGLSVMLERLPDFRTPEGFVPEFTLGEVRGVSSLPLSFTPGARIDTSRSSRATGLD